jgi:HK97 family phage major capsid protein
MNMQLAAGVRAGIGALRLKEGAPGNANTPTPQEELQQVVTEFRSSTQEIKRFATEVSQELKQTGDLSRATKDNVDKALAKNTELQARLSDVEQRVAKAIREGAPDERPPSVGEQVSNSEEFKALAKSQRGTARVQVKAITSLTGAAGGVLVAPQRLPLITPPPRPYRVRSLLAPGRTSSNAIIYPRELTRTNNAAIVVEGAQKPESNVTFEEVTGTVKTIAHWLPASKQILDDVPYLQSYINNILLDGLADVEDLQLLKGSGTGNDIEGILTAAAAYAAPIVIANATRIDVLRLALLQAALTRHLPTGIVLNPADWAHIELTKDTTGKYIFTNPTTEGGTTLWGKPVVETVAMDAGEFVVGPFSSGAQILDREDSNVTVSTEDRDNFIKNMITIRAEERLALAIYTPASFITGDFPA